MSFLKATLTVTVAAAAAWAQNDWRSYGGTDPGGSVENRRYSTLKQINVGNVTKLVQAGLIPRVRRMQRARREPPRQLHWWSTE